MSDQENIKSKPVSGDNPSALELVSSAFIQGMNTGKVLNSKEERERRMDICSNCKDFIQARKLCGVCSCGMSFRTRLIVGHCVRGYW